MFFSGPLYTVFLCGECNFKQTTEQGEAILHLIRTVFQSEPKHNIRQSQVTLKWVYGYSNMKYPDHTPRHTQCDL